MFNQPFDTRTKDSNRSQFFYGSQYFSAVPQAYQAQITERIANIATDESHPLPLRAHATLELGICILSGFGVDQDIDIGLKWVLAAANGGCRKARAVARRLQRSYGRACVEHEDGISWLSGEAMARSHWAFEELAEQDPWLYDQTLRDAVFYHPTAVVATYYFKQVVKPRFNLSDPDVLREQLKREFGSMSANRELRPPSPHGGFLSPPRSSGRFTDRRRSAPVQQSEKYTAPGQSDAKPPITKPMQIRTLEFFNVAFRFVCCFGSVETLRVLLREQARLAPGLTLANYIPVALAVGQGEVALTLLETAAEVTQENSPHLLFQLHHLPAQQVEPVARAIINRGFDVNGKVDLHKDRRFNRDRVSVFCDEFPGLGMYRPEAGDYYHHWIPEIRGRSLTPLRWALYHGHEHLVRVLLDLGAEFPRLPDVEACVAHGRPLYQLEDAAFTVAVLDEPCFNINILKMFFERHGNQSGRAVFAETPLGLIVMEPDCPQRRLRFSGRRGEVENLYKVLSLLRRYQPGSDAQLFWAAAMNGHVDIVRYLVKEGVSIETRHHGQTPLHTAVLHGQKEVFRFLMENGANVHALTSDKGMSVMHLLFWKPKPVGTELSMLDDLHRLLGSVTVSSGDFGRRVQPIHLAALNSRVKALERLMELGADPTIPIEEDIMPTLRGCFRLAGWTPPETLNKNNNNNNNNTAPADAKTTGPAAQLSVKGLTPAGIILARNDILLPTDVLAMLRILVLPKSTPTTTYPLSRIYTRPSLKQTIFHLLACHFSLLETGILPVLLHRLSPLLPRTDLLNLPDADGDTPLHYAALFSGSNNTRAVDCLLALGADPTVKNGYGMTPGTVRAWYFVCKGRSVAAGVAASASGSGSADVGRGGGGGVGSGGWGEKMVQFGIPLRSRERPAGDSSSFAGGEGDGAVKWWTTYWGGRTESCMRLREAGGEDVEGKEVKMMGQLLRGAKVRQVWDLHDGQWVRFGREMVVQLVTEADMREGF
ncbi:hypothetical protein C8A01DRAFT_13575 [Parachaetomium inaequale]|uniref:Ankyrin n=1 Tax=Parachaetomium inaequale TaxID=2588326 RepID=A0AAN6PKZ3_9PEZI|nr:hypothetical protein C8A01DRAFT_13575 [Parachaetomium inaequale]